MQALGDAAAAERLQGVVSFPAEGGSTCRDAENRAGDLRTHVHQAADNRGMADAHCSEREVRVEVPAACGGSPQREADHDGLSNTDGCHRAEEGIRGRAPLDDANVDEMNKEGEVQLADHRTPRDAGRQLRQAEDEAGLRIAALVDGALVDCVSSLGVHLVEPAIGLQRSEELWPVCGVQAPHESRSEGDGRRRGAFRTLSVQAPAR
eukprot:3720125-Prymnesium_polylepis.1